MSDASTSEYRPIHHHIWRPHKGLFGNYNRERAKSILIMCNADECTLHSVGMCACLGVLPERCPHGQRKIDVGWTKRAKKYLTWIKQREERHADVPKLKSGGDFGLSICGDYIYLPYAHMGMSEDYRVHREPFCRSSIKFIPREKMTPSLVHHICQARPMAMMGGEITDYQRKSVPTFLLHLKERLPELATQVTEAHPAIGRAKGGAFDPQTERRSVRRLPQDAVGMGR
jgi:hypothetical protein